MEGQFRLKTTTRVYMNDSLESRRQTKQHIAAHARTVLCIFHTMLISKSAPFMLYICIVVKFIWFNQSIFSFPESLCWKWCNKNKSKNKTKTTKKQIIIIDYYMVFFISHVISTLYAHISPRTDLSYTSMYLSSYLWELMVFMAWFGIWCNNVILYLRFYLGI
jgi:hypothetical protein